MAKLRRQHSSLNVGPSSNKCPSLKHFSALSLTHTLIYNLLYLFINGELDNVS